MLNRNTIFAISAALALALVPVAASAKAGHGGGGHRGGHHAGHHGGHHGKHHVRHGGHRHAHNHHRHHHHHHVRWHRHGTGLAYGPGYEGSDTSYAAVSSPAAGSCNCLTKSYTETGAVVFKDVCTQETAMNPEGKQAQAD